MVWDRCRQQAPSSLYVHIPFCPSRCFYCDFTTYVAPPAAVEAYVDALCQEFALLAELRPAPLQTVFFGGGTPTHLHLGQWEQVWSALTRWLPLAPAAEVSVEANPGRLSRELLQGLRSLGVNRLSLGAQALDDRLLLTLGRQHSADDVRRSVELARAAGFTRINLDLMFGLPEQSLADVAASVREVVALGVPHISAYWLKVEAGTPFAEWQALGLLTLPGEDVEAEMYGLVREQLAAAGYVHYEVSNFAQPGEEARHNLVYWRNEPYLAAGVGAHGYVYGERYENVRSLLAYQQALAAGRRPVAQSHQVSAAEAAEDTVMLGLRLRAGVSAARFYERHGADLTALFMREWQALQRLGLVTWAEGAWRLTERAWPVANEVFARFVGVLTEDAQAVPAPAGGGRLHLERAESEQASEIGEN
ncbi:MAG: radical SAM family heme chaperone HemW [Alicyclobacillus sp.]|nr:radical SAM family heme chaperone HemW [Alicyclobacillus sp.]